MDKDLIADKLYQIIDQLKRKQNEKKINEKKITPARFCSILLNEIHPFFDGNSRTYKILFANYEKKNY